MRANGDSAPAPRAPRLGLVYLLLTGLTAVLQALAAYVCWQAGDPVRFFTALLGVALALAMLALSLRRPLPELAVNRLAVSLATLWLGVETALALPSEAPVRQHLLTNAAITAVLAFTLLPIRQSAPLVTLIYVFLVGIALQSPGTDHVYLLMNVLLVGLIGFMSVYGRQVSVERARSAWLQELAFRDPLTGVANRHIADDELDTLMDPAAGPPGDVAIAVLDLDHFKSINDTLGHVRGDQALVHIARLVEAHLRPGDTLARWGGEEFLVILRGVGREEARARIEGVLETVKVQRLRGFPPITLSAGGAMLTEAPDRTTLLSLADRRLYVAKNAGRDQAVWEDG